MHSVGQICTLWQVRGAKQEKKKKKTGQDEIFAKRILTKVRTKKKEVEYKTGCFFENIKFFLLP